MLSLYTRFKARLATRDRGASAVEYALMVAGIAAVIMAVVFLFGQAINGVFEDTCDTIAGAGSCTETE